MGAESFVDFHKCDIDKVSAEEAFQELKEEAWYDHGHSGYTGTIAEKIEFKVVGTKTTLSKFEGEQLLDYIMNVNDEKCVTTKWGPCGCIKTTTGYWFFGVASC